MPKRRNKLIVTKTPIRDRVLGMLHNGKSVKQVATYLRLSVKQIAAYKAHQTMGRY